MVDEERVYLAAEPEILLEWSARKVRPVVLVWLALVFLVFLAVAHFGVHSREAVTGLLAAGVTAIGTTAPSVINRVGYRATAVGLEKLPPEKKKKGEYATVFRWDELSHARPGKYNVKYYKRLDEPNALKRFWKLHVSDAWSGEFHLEADNRDAVLALLERRGVPSAPPDPE